MSPEKELVRILRERLTGQLRLPEPASMKQRDFEFLADAVFEKSQVRISLSTLKRLWKDDGRTPQVFTLNALVALLGYSGWSEFKAAHLGEVTPSPGAMPIPRARKRTPRPGVYLAVVLGLLVLFIGIRFVWTENAVQPGSGIVFKNRNILASGVPNTVSFEYDISRASFDSAFVQHTWDKRLRERVSAANHVQTFIYYYPGYHKAKLMLNDSIVKTLDVNIRTRGWEALVDGMGERTPRYIPRDSIRQNGRLYVSKRTLIRSEIPIADKEFYVNYFNVGNIGEVKASDFTFETTLRNSLSEGAFVCQEVQVTLICEDGMISVPLVNPGCAANVHLHIGEVFLSGKKNDLSAFGADLEHWNDLEIRCRAKRVTVAINGKAIYSIAYTKDLGKVTGLHYKFFGCGAVTKATLLNAKGLVSFEEPSIKGRIRDKNQQ